jgi:hypothetical protein
VLEENVVEDSEEFEPKRRQNIPLHHGKIKTKQVHRSVLGELLFLLFSTTHCSFRGLLFDLG